jgi:hypothetical protein
MSCDICGQKRFNCDCTEGDIKAYNLEQENSELKYKLDIAIKQIRGFTYKNYDKQCLQSDAHRCLDEIDPD